MALSSQSARPVSRRSHMYRRRRKRGRMRAVVVGVLIVAAGWVGLRLLRSAADGEGPGNGDAGMVAMRTGEIDGRATRGGRDEDVPWIGEGAAAERRDRAAKPADEPPVVSAPLANVNAPAPDPVPARPEAAPARTVPAPVPAPASSSSTPDTGGNAAPADSRARRRALQSLASARARLSENDPVEARRLFSDALLSGTLSEREADETRRTLAGINERLVFSPEVVEGDPFAFRYKISGGDTLAKIVKRMSLQVDWRFIQRVNRIARPQSIREGQLIKLVTGPFHAVVHKEAYRMDVFLGVDEERVYVTSFRVGLGEFDSTPIGRFGVRPDSKLINPVWRNPRTGERFDADDPDNPIGERWIGLVGLDESLRDVAGYGIHGTIVPESIGEQASMGCVRMLPGDVEIIYELLVERASFIDIVRE